MPDCLVVRRDQHQRYVCFFRRRLLGPQSKGQSHRRDQRQDNDDLPQHALA